MHPKELSIKDFSYELPPERIASFPLQERDASKLLIYHRGKITEDIYKNISHHLPGNSLLVFNDTRVVEARIIFKKSTGAEIEIFCLEPGEQYADINEAMKQQGYVHWNCLIGGASKWKHGQVLEKEIITKDSKVVLHARFVEKHSDSFTIAFSWEPHDMSFADVLHSVGNIPLPPYIKRPPVPSDSERYQTVFANHEGSVAAPTAALHFTKTTLQSLEAKNIQTDFLTLHVGAGTFKPVKSLTMAGHQMHAEFFSVTTDNIKNLIAHLNKNIIAVGTTSLRTIETLYWLGIKFDAVMMDENDLHLTQWEAYELECRIEPRIALENVLNFMVKKNITRLNAKTQLIIAPPYHPKIVHGLITNFHQPQSTLLLLVAALIGKDWKKVYDYALENNFRFLSYGDGSLLWIEK